MKTSITSLFAICLLPAALAAQPTVSNNEFYNAGDVIQMVNCNASGINAGASGAGVTWDFSGLVSSGMSTTTIAASSSASYPTANLMETLPTGQTAYLQENSTDTYIDAIVDPATGATTTYDRYDESRRPFTYNTVVVDSYNVTVSGTSSSAHGNGFLTHTGDGYGTLTLPTGTFNNVLRIKKVQSEIDTVVLPSAYNTSSNSVSYLWFDGTHAAPLLRMDSVTSSTGLSATVMYLSSALSVANVKADVLQYTAWFDDNTLQLTGNFESSKVYDVVVYDMIGSKIFTGRFQGNSGKPQFDAGRNVAPGIYIVSVADNSNPSSREMIKIVKH